MLEKRKIPKKNLRFSAAKLLTVFNSLRASGLRTIVGTGSHSMTCKELPASLFFFITRKNKYRKKSEIWFFFLLSRFQIFHVNLTTLEKKMYCDNKKINA